MGPNEQIYVDFMAAKLTDVAARLDDMAAKVCAEMERLPKAASYADLAAGVQHSVVWAVANLNLDSLTKHAASADVARAKGE